RAFAPAPGVRTMAGVMFLVAAVSIAGLPPLSGFIGKTMLLQSVPDAAVRWAWPVILGSSMLVVVGMTRAGTRIFWKPAPAAAAAAEHAASARGLGRARLPETLATMLLLSYGVAMALAPAPILR